jgi:hypothetical protein
MVVNHEWGLFRDSAHTKSLFDMNGLLPDDDTFLVAKVHNIQSIHLPAPGQARLIMRGIQDYFDPDESGQLQCERERTARWSDAAIQQFRTGVDPNNGESGLWLLDIEPRLR